MKLRVSALLGTTVIVCGLFPPAGRALDPRKSLSQYSRMSWTQEHGLPQDTIRTIAQTSDGYLWLGTDEGLARFDGYEFAVFNKANGDLPANSITALASSADGSLWIGTPNGLVQYREHHFQTFTTRQGLPDDAISFLYEDHAGDLWIVAGVHLSRFRHGRFTNFAPGADLPITAARIIREDGDHNLWVAGFSAMVRLAGDKFVPMVDARTLKGQIVTAMTTDRAGNLWIGGSNGVIVRSPSGQIRRYTERDGLPDTFVRAMWNDRDGSIWVGTNAGIARLEGSRFVSPEDNDEGLVRCLFEDREGNLWVGSNDGLTRYRDATLAVYGKSEGLPSDEPNTVFQDRGGRIWVGFHDSGLMLFSRQGKRVFTTRDGLPNNEIFNIREARDGSLLIAARGGLVRMRDGRFTTFHFPDSLSRFTVFDALEDSSGRIWLASASGLGVLENGRFRLIVRSEPLLVSSVVALCQTRDGAIWAGTYGKGLFRVEGDSIRQFTTGQGLSSDQIRALYQDPGGTLWIGTFGGGLDSYRDGVFQKFTAENGLLSDNVADVLDDGESLWLSTTRGICRIARAQLAEFAAHRRTALQPTNYGVADGLRSAQCSPSYPIGGGGHRTTDGRLWFTTSRGIAVFEPSTRKQTALSPAVRLVEISVDSRPFDFVHESAMGPRTERIQIRYTGIHLSAPERLRYSYQLEGLDRDWIRAVNRRVINYNSLHHGKYRFVVRAQIMPDGPVSEASYAFQILPRYYETAWFRIICALALVAAGWAVYQLRLRQIRGRFALVLAERARLAREIHDTLAQGFVGISSQLDAVAMCMPEETTPARKYLDLARRMARHSLTEARRSVMDLRSSALEGQDLAAALESGTRMWTAGSPVAVEVEVSGTRRELPQEKEQHLLRIAQEAVTNVLKHAGATRIRIKLHMEDRKLYLRINDNGHGFDQDGAFTSIGGHFGLIGMRERAERLGGEFSLASHPGEGTEVEVKVPLS